jgi:restriction system protein
MPVPDFQSWFILLLRQLGDDKEHRVTDLYDLLADEAGLTDQDRAELLKSGKAVYENRIAWARTYLKKAGLIESPARGTVRITERGRGVLRENPQRLDVSYLRRYPEFLAFHQAKPEKGQSKRNSNVDEDETPLETLERVHEDLRVALEQELLERVRSASPAFFERLVVDLLVGMGYGGSREDAGRTVGRSGDGGIDGVINEDRLGLDVVYIQAKRWDAVVGRPVVQAFAGSLDGVRAKKGVLLTTSSFSQEARQYASSIEKKIVLIDGRQLAAFMIQHNVGVTVETVYEIKKMDSDYFGD